MTRVRRAFGVVGPPLLILACGLAALEGVTRAGWVPRFLVPRPSEALAALWFDRGEIGTCLGQTAAAAVLAFALSVVGGVAVAVVLASGVWVRRALLPYAVFLQTVPIIAIAPLLAVWFGQNINAVVASAFIASVFPVIANTLAGLLSTDPALVDLFRLYRAGRVSTLLKLRLPCALPQTFSGLRVASALAVIGSVVGEFITGGGLGGLVVRARQQRALDEVFAVLLVLALLGVAMFAIIQAVARLTLRHWHASER